MITEQRETVLTVESPVRHPGNMITSMFADLRNSRFIAWRLFIRDVSARYRQTALGFLWAFIPPLAAALGLTLATRAEVIRIAATDLPYPAYVIISMTLWQTFAEAVNGPIQAVIEAKTLITKINLPREALILAKLADIGLNFLIKLLLIGAVFLWFGIQPGVYTISGVLAVVALIILGTAIGLFLAPLAALYLDIGKGMNLALGAWLFITPVFYPRPTGGMLANIVALNPVTALLVTARELICELPLTLLPQFWTAAAASAALFALGWIVFRLALPFVIERAGA
jgi:lipopolysaccharide transport system permease protein